ncbi:MAG TPA: thioredoxin domain-containing protein [Gemmatimonadales bacterium]|nr:thioredoxin domain-containing protein [Gemmatimonadales bacterium]HRX17676.1 thioredoxin domain-containing protein [Gemmatimonadales bacterium]
MITGVVIFDRVLAHSVAAPAAPLAMSIPDWQSYAAHGQRAGRPDAPVTIVEFSDFQCPFCAALQPILDSIRQQYPDEVALVFRHFPLNQIHPAAQAAAVASECASEAGRFWEYHDLMFNEPGQIGAIPFDVLALSAGIVDTAEFNRCRESDGIAARIAEDVSAGERLRIPGTPTVLINDQLLHGPLDLPRLQQIIRSILSAETQ